MDALGQQHLLKGTDGVGNAGLEDVIGVHQQSGGVGVELTVGLEGGVLVGEHLDPGVSHRAAGRGAVYPVSQRAGGAGTPGDIGGAGPQHRGVGPLGPAGAKLGDGAALGRPHDAVGLGGDERLMVEDQQYIGLDKLGLNGRGPDGEDGLPGEDGRALGDRPDVTGELKMQQILQKRFGKDALSAQKIHILGRKAQILNVVDDLLQACGDSKAAAVRYVPEEDVEVADLLVHSGLEVAVAHGELVKVAEKGIVVGVSHDR